MKSPTSPAPKIEFKKVLRNCGHNDQIIKNSNGVGKPRGLIYDYQVIVDGEYRATWSCTSSYRRGYSLEAIFDITKNGEQAHVEYGHNEHVPNYYRTSVTEPSEGCKDRAYAVTVNAKAEFLPNTECLLKTGRIPTVAELRAQYDESVAAFHRKKAFQKQQFIEDAISRRAQDMWKVLKGYINGDGIDPMAFNLFTEINTEIRDINAK